MELEQHASPNSLLDVSVIARQLSLNLGVLTAGTRSRRRKCEINSPGIGCTHCIRRGFQCSLLTVSPTASGELSTPFTSPHGYMRIRDLTVELPPQSLCEELVDLYFRFIHDTFHSLFHHPTMVEDVSQGTVPPVILYAMISLSARSV